MFVDTEAINGRPTDWRTAGILDRGQAHLFVGRLTDAGIDHRTYPAGRAIRIMVQAADLHQAIDRRLDKSVAPTKHRHHQPNYTTYLRMLVSVPLGAVSGSVYCFLCDHQSRLIPAASAVAMVVVVEVIAICIQQSRDDSSFLR